MAGNRVTYNMLKQWVSESDFAKLYGMKAGSSNGYYYIDMGGERVVWGETPLKCWQGFNYMKTGYYMGLKDK